MKRAPTRATFVALSLAAMATLAPQAVSAYPVTSDPIVQVSGGSPLAPCLGDQAGSGINFVDSEVEPWLAVNPADPDGAGPLVAGDNLIGAWQQDRWNNGGSRGNVVGYSMDGGATWTLSSNTKSSICTGGTAANGGSYERASDPWVTISPDGTAYLMSLSVDTNPGGFGTSPNAMLVSRSTDGGASWEDPITLKRDTSPNALNDKNSMTADPFDSNYVYAIWDRLVSPPGETPNPTAFENALGFKGPTWFTRTTDGGDTWEPARIIFDPAGENQTIGNQIVVTGQGDLVDGFDLIRSFSNRQGGRGFSIAVLRSEDRGATWPKHATIVDRHNNFQGSVFDPDDPNANTRRVRTGDILPEIASDLNNENVYLVWQDLRWGGVNRIAFSQSDDGGRTWSPTIRINQTPDLANDANEQAFTPSVRVLDDGTIVVTYYDFRNNLADPTLLTDYFSIHCHPATTDCSDPDSWAGTETRLTDTSFNMKQAPFARGSFTGDYEGLDTDGTDFFPFWSMPHGADPASIFVRRTGP
jgi:hypothetical protein